MWHYAEQDQQRGPVARESLRGKVARETLVWREGLSDWVPAGSLVELSDLFAAPTVAMPPPMSMPSRPAPMAQPIPIGARTLYAGTDPSGLAIASLICGIVGLVFMCAYGIGIVPAVIAVVLGYMARGRGATGADSNAGLATAGIVMGWIPIALVAVMFLIGIILAVFFAIAN